jgi:hypothetical protein
MEGFSDAIQKYPVQHRYYSLGGITDDEELSKATSDLEKSAFLAEQTQSVLEFAVVGDDWYSRPQ